MCLACAVIYFPLSLLAVTFILRFLYEGHGDNIARGQPTLIQALNNVGVIDIVCGGSYRLVINFTLEFQFSIMTISVLL